MAGRFEEWAGNFRLYFAGENGQRLLNAIGAALGDRMEQGGILANREVMPEYATEHAHVEQVGAERGIEAGPLLANADEARLVRSARSLNRFRGTPLGMLLALHYGDFTHASGGAVLITQNGLAWYLSGDPSLDDLEDVESDGVPSWLTKTTNPLSNPAIPAASAGPSPRTTTPAVAALSVDWYSLTGGPMDANGDQWTARFAVLFPFGVVAGASLATTANLVRIRRLIREWKPAKTNCVGIYISTSGVVWGWGANWAGGGVTYGGSPTVFYAAS